MDLQHALVFLGGLVFAVTVVWEARSPSRR